MIVVIGTENCSRCNMVKNILNNKNIEYRYTLIDDYSVLDQSKYLEMAQSKGLMSYPMIFKDEEMITLQQL